MEFALTILGVSGATPAYGRYPTCQFLQIHNHHFLIDCGEGAQMRLSDFGLPKGKINHVFISHLHGDHIFGLPGLLFSMALNDRTRPLHIYSPVGLEEMITAQLTHSGAFPYPLHFHIIDTTQNKVIFENKDLTVQTIPLQHRIETAGFLFREKRVPKNIDPAKIKLYNLSVPQIISAKEGKDVILENGQNVSNNELTFPPYVPRSYAFASDTLYNESIIPIIEGVDLLYHETTFCEDGLENAARTFHSTAKQAANIALKAGVGQLITGHYSSRYKELNSFLEEASSIFPNTELGEEGRRYEIKRCREQ